MSRNNVLPTAREITSHRVNGLNEALKILVLDAPGHGGACHEYVILTPMEAHDEQCEQNNAPRRHDDTLSPISIYRLQVKPNGPGEIEGVDLHICDRENCAWLEHFDTTDNDPVQSRDFYNYTRISFQNGPIKEHGVNGLSQESLLAVLKDRLEGFQSGQFACRDNAIALTKIDEARLWLHNRTLERVSRGVEGTTVK